LLRRGWHCAGETNEMIKFDGMLMIGSAGAKVGKTELACEILREFGKSVDIIGIKVTAIKQKDGQCPRGGLGCGVCSSLEGDFCITEETNTKSQKDTARLLAAGASRVFWLRVLKSHLKEGLTALLDIIGPNAISICESNSLRHVVEPGLFLVVRGRNSKIWKNSAGDVKKYADRIVVSNGDSFDFNIGRIKLADGRWLLKENATAIVMAGGSSSRMDTDKSMLHFDGRPLIERICEQLRGTFSQILISSNESEKFAFLGHQVVADKVPGQGPLMGIASALEISSNEINFVIACDIPYINLSFVRKMLAEAVDMDMVIPIGSDGKYEPLFAVYCKSALAAINEVLASGRRRISDVFSRCRVKYIELAPDQVGGADWLVNINTMSEYEEYRKKCYGS
jgi:molybdopterin-guanine dinucleotide biosynthesis protein A